LLLLCGLQLQITDKIGTELKKNAGRWATEHPNMGMQKQKPD